MVYGIRNLYFKYPKESFSINISDFVVKENGITGIFGKSGSGKTTFLINLAFLYRGIWEDFLFFDKKIESSNFDEKRREATYVAQNPVLFKTSVFSNMAYGMKIRRYKKEEVKERVEVISKKLDIGNLLSQKASTVSGGEAQRVCLGRALLCNPKVILLDEPTSNLDRYNKERIEDILKILSEETKLILVSHETEQINRLCKEIFEMEEGKINRI